MKIQKHPNGPLIHLPDNKRKPLARHVYEQHYGPIPPKHIVYHLDGDSYNNDPPNLKACTRRELIKRNLNQKLKLKQK